MTINVTILVVLLNSGMLGSGVNSFQNSILPSGSICCYNSFLSTNVDSMVNYLAGSNADQVEILIGCVDAWEASGMADSPDSDHFNKLVCTSYLEAYNIGFLEPNSNNSSLYELKASFWYEIRSKLSMDGKASFDVVISNTVSSGFSIGVNHRENADKNSSISPVKTANRSFSYLSYKCVLLIIFIIVILGFVYL